jgi:hypothetical protein
MARSRIDAHGCAIQSGRRVADSPFDVFQAELARVHAEGAANPGLEHALHGAWDDASSAGCSPLTIVPQLLSAYMDSRGSVEKAARVDAVAGLGLDRLRAYSRPSAHLEQIAFDVVVIAAFESALLAMTKGSPYPTGLGKALSLGARSLTERRHPMRVMLEDTDAFYGNRICSHFRAVVGSFLVSVEKERLASGVRVARLLSRFRVESSKQVGELTSDAPSYTLAGRPVRVLLAPKQIQRTRAHMVRRFGAALAAADVLTPAAIERYGGELDPGQYLAAQLPHELFGQPGATPARAPGRAAG